MDFVFIGIVTIIIGGLFMDISLIIMNKKDFMVIFTNVVFKALVITYVIASAIFTLRAKGFF